MEERLPGPLFRLQRIVLNVPLAPRLLGEDMPQHDVNDPDRLVIEIPPGISREYVYTDKVAAHWSGETSAAPTRSYHGLCVRMQKLLETWRFQVNGVWLDPAMATVRLYPHLLERVYPGSGVRETVCLLDGLAALVVELQGRGLEWGVWRPMVDIRPVRQPRRTHYQVRWRPQDRLLLLRGDLSIRGSPPWLGLGADVPLNFEPHPRQEKSVYRRGQLRGVMAEGYPYEPGSLSFRAVGGRARFLCLAGHSQKELQEKVSGTLNSARGLILRKKKRLQRLLSICPVHTEHTHFNTALAWARISLDALIMNQSGWGIFAGFPWFANYWGRDTCISLPGATWVTGQFSLARKLLSALAGQQDRRPGSRTYGRIPNLLEPGTRMYNTADGTLWFVRQLDEYGRYSGDRTTLRRLFPAVERALNGEIRLRTDEHGLVRHGPAETWMDAGGDAHPVTPRDDRAVEIQALWLAALSAGAHLALLTGQRTSAERWQRLADRVQDIFSHLYWDRDRGYLYDHIDADGSPDRQIRPNALLALTVPRTALLSRDQERSVLKVLLRRLVTPYGVSTLDADDPQFRPQHLGGRRYHFDQAYHNGDVWPWLTGPLVTALVKHGHLARAHALTEVLTTHILEKGSTGTLSELFNAVPIEENDNEAGAYAQAWSLAEYIRVVYQDYLGIRPDGLRGEVVVQPAIPAEWGTVHFSFAVGRAVVAATCRRADTARRFQFHLHKGDRPLRLLLRVMLPRRKLLTLERVLKPGRRVRIEVAPDGTGWKALINGRRVAARMTARS
jgi:glycogen debranching enzyme